MPYKCPECGYESPDGDHMPCPDCGQNVCLACYFLYHLLGACTPGAGGIWVELVGAREVGDGVILIQDIVIVDGKEEVQQ